MSENTDTTTWPERAIGLYGRLTERNAEIAYHFDNFEVGIPSSTEADAKHAHWKWPHLTIFHQLATLHGHFLPVARFLSGGVELV